MLDDLFGSIFDIDVSSICDVTKVPNRATGFSKMMSSRSSVGKKLFENPDIEIGITNRKTGEYKSADSFGMADIISLFF